MADVYPGPACGSLQLAAAKILADYPDSTTVSLTAAWNDADGGTTIVEYGIDHGEIDGTMKSLRYVA